MTYIFYFFLIKYNILIKEDVYDGSMWKNDPELLSRKKLAIGIFTEGLSPFRSSKKSFWIVYVFLLNLPIKESEFFSLSII